MTNRRHKPRARVGRGIPASPAARRLVELETEVHGLREQLAVESDDREAQEEAWIEAQRELEQSRERYADLFDSAPTGYVWLDRSGFIREANLTFARMLGVSRDRLINTLLVRFVVEKDRSPLLRHLSRCWKASGSEPVITELALAGAGGRVLEVELTSVIEPPPPKPFGQVGFRTAVVDITARKQGEAALRASEEQYRLLFELNPNPMWIFDAATLQFLAVNEAAVKHYGWSQAEFLRLTVKDVRPPEEVPKLAEKLEQQRDMRLAFFGEWRHWKKDRTLLDVEVTVSCIQFQGRDVRLTMVNDITQRKRVEAALRASEQRLALAVSGARIGLFQWDVATGKTLWTTQHARLLGYPATRATTTTTLSLKYRYRDWARRIHREDLPRVETELRRCLAKRLPFETEYRVVWPDKSVHWLAARGVCLQEAPGQSKQMLGMVMDITERKRTELLLKQLNATLEQRVGERTAELSDAHDRLRAIMDNTLVGILTVSEGGLVQTINPAISAIFGYSPEELAGSSVNRLMASPAQPAEKEFLSYYTAPGDPRFMAVGREVLGRRKDGEVIVVELTVSEFRHGDRREYVLMIRDISARKRLEREVLEAAERERQRLGRDLHDGLGQHLHALYYMASLLEKELKETAPARAPEMGRLARQLEHGLELTRSFARGLQPVSAAPEGLMLALRELAERTRGLYRTDCRFLCRAPVLVQRPIAANHLYRIAQEAVNNAMKHAKPTRIRLQLTATPQRIVLGVRDNGVGFPRRTTRSNGMGLQVMQYRAEAIGGSLLVQRHPQGGTEVVCTVNRQALLPPEESRS